MNKKGHVLEFCLWLMAICICSALFIPGLTNAGTFKTTMPTVLDPNYKVEILVPGDYFHGLKGCVFDNIGKLIVGDLIGGEMYTVDPNTGDVKLFLKGPLGLEDDVEFGPDGRLCWTAPPEGKAYCMHPGKDRFVAAEGLPFINGMNFDKDGRLFVSQSFGPPGADSLWEIDPDGKKKPREVIRDLGWLNGFQFGPDGKIYGPLMRMDKRSIVRIDVETGKVETITKDFKKGPFTVDSPNCVRVDSKGTIYGIQAATGEIYRVDVNSGKNETIVKLDPGLDNFTIDSKGKIFVTNMIHNSIYEVDPATKKVRTIHQGRLTGPQGIVAKSGPKGDEVYVADTWAIKRIDGTTGEIENLWGSHFEFPVNAWLDGDTIIDVGLIGQVGEFELTTGKNNRVLYGFEGASKAVRLKDGTLLVAMLRSGQILKVSGPEGKERTPIAERLAGPVSLELADQNTLYVAEFFTGNIYRVDIQSGKRLIVAAGLARPSGTALTPDGKMLVVELGEKRLTEVDLKTGQTKPILENLPVGIPSWGPPVWTLPGVAVAPSGAIYVSGDVENAIYKVTRK